MGRRILFFGGVSCLILCFVALPMATAKKPPKAGDKDIPVVFTFDEFDGHGLTGDDTSPSYSDTEADLDCRVPRRYRIEVLVRADSPRTMTLTLGPDLGERVGGPLPDPYALRSYFGPLPNGVIENPKLRIGHGANIHDLGEELHDGALYCDDIIPDAYENNTIFAFTNLKFNALGEAWMLQFGPNPHEFREYTKVQRVNPGATTNKMWIVQTQTYEDTGLVPAQLWITVYDHGQQYHFEYVGAFSVAFSAIGYPEFGQAGVQSLD